MKHNTISHLLLMVGGLAILVLIQELFNVNAVFLYPLLCMGMMVWMMVAMGRDDHSNHK